MPYINEHLTIPDEELKFTFSRSPGPGGQHVNTSSTRVTLSFDLGKTRSLSPLQKMIVQGKLRRRIGKDGVLRLSTHDTRSQADNRALAVERFVELLRGALEPVLERIRPKVSRTQKKKRLETKKRRAQVKRLRSSPLDE
ncbi:MAG: alternative ribosome rescue aminoacyl-tRNA hydrolase ArfB [Desulfovibrionaceae bacterium]